MWGDIGLLIFSLGLVLIGCELFTNGVEWLGFKLGLGDGLIGSVFSAVGTCLPETMIPIMSLIMAHSDSGYNSSNAIETTNGAILGAPFMLGTLAFFVTGLAAIIFEGRRCTRNRLIIDKKVISRDLSYFVCTGLCVFAFSLLNSFCEISYLFRVVFGIFLLFVYINYLVELAKNNSRSADTPENLYISRLCHNKISFYGIVFQLILAFGAIIKGASIFVDKTMDVGQDLGISVFFLSSIIVPIATELPEKFNSVIWISKRKDTLALGNITGAMVFQCCIPVAIGVIFGDWKISSLGFVTITIPIFTSYYMLSRLNNNRIIKSRHLLIYALFYLLYLYLNFR